MAGCNSLRRQLFHKNLDMLLQNNTLDTVTEEGTEGEHEPITDPDATVADAESSADIRLHYDSVQDKFVSHSNNPRDSLICTSPIYRPKQKSPEQNIGRNETQIENSRPGTFYSEPWGETCRSKTPVSVCIPMRHEPRTSSKKHPVRGRKEDAGPSVSVSPIKRNASARARAKLSRGDSRSSLFSRGAGHSSESSSPGNAIEENVRPLPMSPAVFAAQAVSTPGPCTPARETPACHTGMDTNNNSLINMSLSECNMCRICHEDGSRERLVSPCHCAGTMGMLHTSCLSKWLGSSNTTKCEICQYQFTVKKKPHPLKWYLTEPSLHSSKRAMLKDVCITITLGLLVLVVMVLCLVFSKKYHEYGQTGVSTALTLIATMIPMTFFVWVLIVGKRIRNRLHQWRAEHQVIHIQEKQATNMDGLPRKPIFQRLPIKLSRKKKLNRKNAVKQSLESSTYISYSMESYKAAMFNPVTPNIPLLDDSSSFEITSLDETSPSVVSLASIEAMDYEADDNEPVSYYQPPEYGMTCVCSDSTGILCKETGV